jgi:hypothetical protein
MKAQAMFAWDYRGESVEVRAWIEKALVTMQSAGSKAAEDQKDNTTSAYDIGGGGPPDTSWHQKFDAFRAQLENLGAWTHMTTSWLAFNDAEIGRQRSYINGDCMKKAEAALSEISMMTGK